MTIEIKALDTLIFRDGKPFGGEDDNWADSLKFPSLTTIYGALRATYFSQNIDEFHLANTEKDPTNKLKIKKFLLKDEANFICPIPQDLAFIKNKEEIVELELEENNFSNNPLKYIFTSSKEVEKKDAFLAISQLRKYLDNLKVKNFILINDLIKDEFKIGIGLNKRKNVVEEGKLFRIGLNRYKNLKFIVELEGIELKKEGFLKLGGEMKGAYYQKTEDIKLPFNENFSNKFKLYFLTPAIFKKGWLPSFINENLEGEIEGIKLKLIAVANTKPLYIGGWDIKKNTSKPMRKVIGAGSVYYFEFEGDKEKLINYFKNNSISDFNKKEGYGMTLIGELK